MRKVIIAASLALVATTAQAQEPPRVRVAGGELAGACSEACAEHPDKRPYDGTGTYPKISNHYTPAQGLASYRG